MIERSPLRYTPAGVPVSEAELRHVSRVEEGGAERRVEFDIPLRAIGEAARWLQAAEFGQAIEIEGFLARKSLNSRQFVLHVNTLKYLEGN